MNIHQITSLLEQWSPLAYAEDFDNVGLLVGEHAWACSGVLVTHDVTEAVVQEAIDKQLNLIICFHPILFQPLKKITGKNYVERVVMKAIENRIGIYAVHTALDNHRHGVSYQLGALLGLQQQRILIPQKNALFQLTTYVPIDAKDRVLRALHEAGAGQLGEYTQCGFSTEGIGQFKGSAQSNPTIGQQESLSEVPETCLTVVVPKHTQKKVLEGLFSSHPYESPAYALVELLNDHPDVGMGSIGELEQPMAIEAFLTWIQQQLHIPHLRHSAPKGTMIQKVAVLGGSGSFCIGPAMAQGADALVTADLKYHDFFKADKNLLLVDAGHYETEHFTKKIIHDYLTKKIPNFAITLSAVQTNPVKYF